MRRIFSKHLEELAKTHDDLIFVTGDLGFNAFENLKEIMGERFINAGVAEQSMVSMAAGLASQGHRVFVYSIAPFLVYRALEQIRNDVCFHQMPVFLVGNGGGYGYGIMGSSHHALSDLAVISSLPDITAYIPAFNSDVIAAMDTIMKQEKPAYLRLGLGKDYDAATPDFKVFRRLSGNPVAELTLAAAGPVIRNIIESEGLNKLKSYVDIFTINALPFTGFSDEFELSLRKTGRLMVVEEHVPQGGAASAILLEAAQKGIKLSAFKSRHALYYPDNTYGDQAYHQKQSGLDEETLIKDMISILSK